MSQSSTCLNLKTLFREDLGIGSTSFMKTRAITFFAQEVKPADSNRCSRFVLREKDSTWPLYVIVVLEI
jgi:hypothetical protein